MNKLVSLLVATVLILSLAGCRSWSFPRFFDPGPAEYQQNRAVQYDPYPVDEAGPPIVGGRPREFAKPLAETPRAQWPRPWD